MNFNFWSQIPLTPPLAQGGGGSGRKRLYFWGTWVVLKFLKILRSKVVCKPYLGANYNFQWSWGRFDSRDLNSHSNVVNKPSLWLQHIYPKNSPPPWGPLEGVWGRVWLQKSKVAPKLGLHTKFELNSSKYVVTTPPPLYRVAAGDSTLFSLPPPFTTPPGHWDAP